MRKKPNMIETIKEAIKPEDAHQIKICGGSLVTHSTSGAEVPGSNPASPAMILMRCRIIVQSFRKSQGIEVYP